MKKFKIALLGAHEIGGMMESPTESADSSRFRIFDIVGVWDPDEEKAETAAKVYGIKKMSFEEILEDESIEVVINSLMPKYFVETTEKLFEHNKNVFAGKMIGYTLDEGKHLLAMARERNLRFGCGPDCVLGASMQTARYIVDHGIIGEVKSGVVSLSRNNFVFGDVLPHLFDKGGNILYDMGGYYLGSMINLIGPVKRVSAFGRITEKTHRIIKVDSEYLGRAIELQDYNLITALLEFESGALVTLHLNSDCVLEQKITFDLYGDKGIMMMGHPHDFNPPVYVQKTGAAPFEFPLIYGIREPGKNVGVAEMCWAITNNRPNRLDGTYALHMLEIAYGIEESIRTGRIYEMTTTCERPEALKEGFVGEGFWGPGEETVLSI